MRLGLKLFGLLAGLGIEAAAGAQETAQMAVTVTNHVVITWNWQEECQLVAYSAGNGRVEKNGEWIGRGSNAVASAIPDRDFAFDRWTGAPAGQETDNPIVIPAWAPIALTALFKPVGGGLEDWLRGYGLTLEQQNEDPDGDGFVNGQEYIADTNPTNGLSHFRPLATGWDGSNLVVTQPETSPSREYALYGKNALDDPEWKALWVQPGNGSNRVWQVNTAGRQGFFRSGVGLPAAGDGERSRPSL